MTKDSDEDFLNDFDDVSNGFDDFKDSDFKSVETTEPIKESFIPHNKQEIIEAKEVKKEIKKQNIETTNTDEEEIPQLIGTDYPEDFLKIVKRIQQAYKQLPAFNFAEIDRELADLSIKSSPTPTLQVLNDEIQKVQASKDRLSEIFVNVLKSFTFKDRMVDVLVDSWARFTNDKSADKRKGDGIFRLSDFILDLAKVEALLKQCGHILKNLDSIHESLSRRITIIQLTLKMSDFSRSALPDYDFSSKKDTEIEEARTSNRRGDIDPHVGTEPKDEMF